MPIPNVIQPDILPVDEELRLRKFDGEFAFAFDWYQDPELIFMVDGIKEPYTMQKLDRMYRYLDSHGELYFIEMLESGNWLPIGDVTLWQDGMPIVIGLRECWGRGIGHRVVRALVDRGRTLGWRWMSAGEIYNYNIRSQRCFEGLGFLACEKTERGRRYRLDLRGETV